MNIDDLRRELIAVARANPVDERVPYAFEKRVMAHLTARPGMDCWAVWSRALWRAAAPCIAVMVLFCAWSLFAPQSNAPTTDLSQAFDNTVLAAVDQEQSADSVW